MQRLILMRHAKTEALDHGMEDAARVLLPRGQSDAGLIAAELGRRGWMPDLVLISSARRTRETWKYMAQTFPDAKTHVLDGLYLAGTQSLEDAVSEHEQAGTLMLLGHNPGMHDFASGISSRAGAKNQKAALTLSAKMPTAATALFEADTDGEFDASRLKLVDYIIAKGLRPPE